MKRGNCLVYALSLAMRHGGYIIVRRSHFHWAIPHVLWAPSIEGLAVREFRPYDTRLKRWLPLRAAWFRGYERSGMGEERSRCRFPNPRIRRRTARRERVR